MDDSTVLWTIDVRPATATKLNGLETGGAKAVSACMLCGWTSPVLYSSAEEDVWGQFPCERSVERRAEDHILAEHAWVLYGDRVPDWPTPKER